MFCIHISTKIGELNHLTKETMYEANVLGKITKTNEMIKNKYLNHGKSQGRTASTLMNNSS